MNCKHVKLLFHKYDIVHMFCCLQLFFHVLLQFLTSLKLGNCSKLNWPKGSLQFIGSLGHYFTPVMLYFRSFFRTFKLFVFIEAPLVCIIGHLQSLSTYIRILKTQTALDNYPKKLGFLDYYSSVFPVSSRISSAIISALGANPP